MATGKISRLDMALRASMIETCLCEKALLLANKIKNGGDCTELKCQVVLISEMYDVICRFDPLIPNNCITEDQLDDMYETISQICGICFPEKGGAFQAPPTIAAGVPEITFNFGWSWMAWRDSTSIGSIPQATQHYPIVDETGCAILFAPVFPSGW